MDRRKFEQYKKIMRFMATMFVVACATTIFVSFWKTHYNAGIVFPFYFKGYWLIAAFYIFFFVHCITLHIF
jgi:hypothetical protein